MQDTFQKHCKGKLEKCSVDRQIEMLNSFLENMNAASLRLKRKKDHPAAQSSPMVLEQHMLPAENVFFREGLILNCILLPLQHHGFVVEESR